MKYARIYAAMLDEIWCIERGKLDAMFAVLESREAGEELARLHESTEQALQRREGSVAVITVAGVLSPYIGSMSEASGGISAERLSGWLDTATKDPDTKAIVLNMRSPGGAVAGIPELAAKIRAAREVKPVIASVNHLAASAAYWLASQATEIAISPSGMAGNIGVLAVREWEEDAEGRKRVVVSAGERKAQASGVEPPDDESIARMQSRVNAIYSQFVGDVAMGRGIDPDHVINEYGKGETLSAEECVKCGAADRIETLEQTLARITAPAVPYNRMRARASL